VGGPSFTGLFEIQFGGNAISEIFYFCGYISVYLRPERAFLSVAEGIEAPEQHSFKLPYMVLAGKHSKLQM
jgi:hypothetical protein